MSSVVSRGFLRNDIASRCFSSHALRKTLVTELQFKKDRYRQNSMRLMSTVREFDFLVIGGGSGGSGAARRAAKYGAKVAVIEKRGVSGLGGTCVNEGCVPKKIMMNASTLYEHIHTAEHFGIEVGTTSFDLARMKTLRDRYITRLNNIYHNNFKNDGVELIVGEGSLHKSGELTEVLVRGENGEETVYAAKNVLIACGGEPSPLGITGEEHAINSDGFFQQDVLPKRAVVLGAGYIAVELAGIYQALGTSTTLCVRKGKALRNFDETISEHLDSVMKTSGIDVQSHFVPKSISKNADGKLTIEAESGTKIEDLDCVLAAVGRRPVTKWLGLENVGLSATERGYIEVDFETQQTKIPGIYALGDVTGRFELTPVAIAAGRRLADRLFGGLNIPFRYENIPTVVFSHPPIGTIGMTEAQARKTYGDDIKIYKSTFVNLFYGQWPIEPSTKPKTIIKLICTGPEEKIVGLHMCGMAVDEILQGFGVAIKMGATKADFDECCAIHPSAAEELTTLAPWGLSGSDPAVVAARSKF